MMGGWRWSWVYALSGLGGLQLFHAPVGSVAAPLRLRPGTARRAIRAPGAITYVVTYELEMWDINRPEFEQILASEARTRAARAPFDHVRWTGLALFALSFLGGRRDAKIPMAPPPK